VLATVPGHADALYFLGLIAYQLNQPEMAIELIGKAIQQNGNISYYHTTCGLALQSLRRFDEALVLLCHFLIHHSPLLPQAAGTSGQRFDQSDGKLTADACD
jgi:hypothetical protein